MVDSSLEEILSEPPPPILIVEDDPDLRAMIERLLAHQGYLVRTAADGRAALECCEQELPSLIFCDLMLPHVDGESFLLEMRERWPEASIPIVLLSASAIRDEIAERIGVTSSLAKPFDTADILALAEEHGPKQRERRAPLDETARDSK